MGKMQATSPFWLSAKLGLVKIPADEVNWRGTSHGTETLSNLHPVASVQLPTAKTSHTRDIPVLQEPILVPHVLLFRIQTYCFHPDYSGVGS